MKVKQTDYVNHKEILMYPDHHVARSVMVSDEGVTAVKGRKIVPAGTLLGKAAGDTFKAVNGENTVGVLLSDTDVTYGAAPAAMVIHGFINKAKIPEQPDTTAKAVLLQIQFI